MERGIKPNSETALSTSEKESLLKSVIYQVAAELNMNQLQEEGFIDHVMTDPYSVYKTNSNLTYERIKTAAEGWMTMRGWRAMYGGNDIDPR